MLCSVFGSGCLRSCMRTMETLCHCSTAAPNWSTGSRPTGRLLPGHSTPKTSCRHCLATTAMLSQVCMLQRHIQAHNIPLLPKLASLTHKAQIFKKGPACYQHFLSHFYTVAPSNNSRGYDMQLSHPALANTPSM